MFTIEQCDFHIQLVDNGRRFCQFLGYTQSGPMDWVSYELANAVVGNLHKENVVHRGKASLECIGGITLVAHSKALLSTAGAIERVFVNDKEQQVAEILCLKEGDRLRVSPSIHGLRYCVAFWGGIDAPRIYSSTCDVAKENVGGISGYGRGLVVGDSFTLLQTVTSSMLTLERESSPTQSSALKTPRANIHEAKTVDAGAFKVSKSIIQGYQKLAGLFSSSHQIPLILSYQHERFSQAQKSLFFGSTYTVTPQHDRMGIRLSGYSLEYANKSLYSEGISNGSVQIAGDGQPMILLVDRQTIGGYPKIGSVGGYGLARLGQVKAGDKIKFYPVSAEECRQQRLISMEMLHQL